MSKLYGVIYADPPWRYENGTPGREIEDHYPTMSDNEICALKVPSMNSCVLYLWATAPKTPEALSVISAWGFRYRTHAVWDKEKLGMGYWFRGQHELLMVATKGIVRCPIPENRISSIIRCPRGPHSAKPDYVRDMIERWFPHASKLEMFARVKRAGWDAFGNEIEYDLLSDNSFLP